MSPITEGDCYDAFYTSDPARDVAFLERLAQSYGLRERLRVLDMGCGTGRLLLPLASVGWDVVGMEPHRDYVAKSRAVVSGTPAGISVVEGGFGELAAVQEFDLILAVGDPWWYLLTPEERSDALVRSYRAVRPGGVVFLDGPNLEWILEHYRAPTPSEVRYKGIVIRREPSHEIDRAGRVWTHVDTFTVPETGERLSTRHRFGIVAVDEITTALRATGFEDIRTYASWSAPSPAPPAGPRLMVAGRRPAG